MHRGCAGFSATNSIATELRHHRHAGASPPRTASPTPWYDGKGGRCSQHRCFIFNGPASALCCLSRRYTRARPVSSYQPSNSSCEQCNESNPWKPSSHALTRFLVVAVGGPTPAATTLSALRLVIGHHQCRFILIHVRVGYAIGEMRRIFNLAASDGSCCSWCSCCSKEGSFQRRDPPGRVSMSPCRLIRWAGIAGVGSLCSMREEDEHDNDGVCFYDCVAFGCRPLDAMAGMHYCDATFVPIVQSGRVNIPISYAETTED